MHDQPNPHTYPYGTPASAPTHLAVASVSLAGLVALVQVGNTVLAFPAADALANSTGDAAFDDISVALYALAALLLFPTCLASYVVTCLWLTQCRRNADRFASDYRHARSPVWVWLGWWVPIVALWFPFQVVRDVRRASIQFRGAGGPLALWWTCWLVWLLGNRIAGNVFPEEAGDSVEALPVVELVNGAAILVGLFLWIRIVREITRGQSQLVQRNVADVPRWDGH